MEYKNAREMKGLAMASTIGKANESDVSIQRLNKLTFKVRSQNDASKWYTVFKIINGWRCECPDFTYRLSKLSGQQSLCKHIHAVIFSKLLRKRVYQDTFPTPINQSIIDAAKVGKIVCQRCGSENYKKSGMRHNKKAGDIQRYVCLDCKYRFTFNPAFENAKASARIMTTAIDLYFKGISIRKIEDHLKQAYNFEIDNSSICRWIRKFNRTVKPYVDSFVPSQVSGVYHVDEMLLHVRKED
ncbi:MAG: SWIM zinc finger family protein, partial [Thermoproteota archaeon]